jgi:hypothetical protein
MKPFANPFPGLRPFRADEEPLFFGREAHVDRMVDALGATGFLAVVGSSGSGKSSLVTCGLVPALHRGLLASRPGGWRVATCRPGNRPIRALAQALAEALAPAGGDAIGATGVAGFSPAALAEATLRASRRGLLDAWQEAGIAASGQPNLLVVVDQFEELFRYRGLGDDRAAADSLAAEAVAFVNLLLEVPGQAEVPLAVVITMRSDFLGECAQFHRLPEAINRGQFLVPRMGRDERRDAVRGPLAVCGAQIDPVLLNRLVNDVGDNPDQLSILQHALNRTWAEWQARGASGPVASAHYDAVGTMEQALDRHANEALATLTAPGQAALCEAVFRAITDRGTDARGIRRPTRMDTLTAITGAGPDALAAVMAPFRDASRAFLMPPDGVALEPATPVDISHESLMRVWTRLRGWTEAEAQSARIYRRLAESAALHAQGETDLIGPPELQVALTWREREKPNATWAERYSPGFDAAMGFLDASRADFEARQAAEQARQQAEAEAQTERQRVALKAQADADQLAMRLRLNKRWRLWTVPLGVLVVLALGWQYQRLVDEARAAREQAQLAKEKSDQYALQAQAAASAQLAAEQSQAALRRLTGQQQATAASEPARTIDPLKIGGVRPTTTAAATTSAAPVYLQFADPAQRPEVERLRGALAGAGYKAPPAEEVAQVPSQSELRYFRTDDAPAAQALAARLPGLGLDGVAVRYAPGYATGVQRQQFELWLARPAASTELARLARDLDAPDKPRRLAAGQALQSRWLGSPEAIAAVLGLLDESRIDTLSETGRLNALFFLSRTEIGAWTPELVQRARSARARILSGEKGGAPAGLQTRAELNRLNTLLDAASPMFRAGVRG